MARKIIYVYAFDGGCKVGITENHKKRFNCLKYQLGDSIETYKSKYLNNNKEIEKLIHNLLDDYRIKNNHYKSEVYSIDFPEIVEFIEPLIKKFGIESRSQDRVISFSELWGI